MTGARAASGSRLYFVDYLRAAIVSLVFLHHTAIMYGASGSWYYIEPATDAAAAGLLSLFTNFNQAWFMGLFFLLSGYFSPESYDRKGLSGFLRDRLLRLGVPLLVFFFLLNPITVYLAFVHVPASVAAAQGLTVPVVLNVQFFPQNAGTGPLWFVEMLLIFDLGYALYRFLARNRGLRGESSRPMPSYRQVVAFTVTMALCEYLLRIVVPINFSVFGFPSLFDLPQYLGLFLVGLAAARGDWLRQMPYSMGRRMFVVALVASATLLPLSIIGTEVNSLGWGTLLGHGSPSSAFYALWDSTFAVGACMFAVGLFRQHFRERGKLWSFLSRNSYAAYVMQAPVIVVVGAFLLQPVHLESLLKFMLAAVIVVPSVWLAAYLVRRIPGAARIL